MLPEGVSVFVFGSALQQGGSPKDLDVLFVYDALTIPPQRIYEIVELVRSALSRIQPLPVHPLVLSRSEEAAERFLARNKSLPLDAWLTGRVGSTADSNLWIQF